MEAFLTVNEAGRDRGPWLVPNNTRVAQLERALVYETRGWGFEYLRECQYTAETMV